MGDIADTPAMIEAAAQHRSAVKMGGGLLGFEAGNGLLPVASMGDVGWAITPQWMISLLSWPITNQTVEQSEPKRLESRMS